MLSSEAVAAAAEALYEAEKSRRQMAPLTLSHRDMDMDDAYAIQKAWVDRKIADGRRVTGYKIGLTSRAMQMRICLSTKRTARPTCRARSSWTRPSHGARVRVRARR